MAGATGRMQAALLGLGLGGALLATIGSVAERRRARRDDPDKVGWVPWAGLVFLGVLTAAIGFALAVKLPG